MIYLHLGLLNTHPEALENPLFTLSMPCFVNFLHSYMDEFDGMSVRYLKLTH